MFALRKRLFALSGFLSAALVLVFHASCGGPSVTVVLPTETGDVLVNPGMGFTTFYSFNGDERNLNHPVCSIAYFRWYWDVLEPEEGQVNFAMIDSLMALARERGEKLAFRVMCQNGHEDADQTANDNLEVPQWYRNSGARGFPYPDGRHWQPDYDDPLFLEKHGNLIRALAVRYDGHPDLDHVDIGSVGRWGEWHVEGLKSPMPTFENQQKIVDLYVDNFKKTPLVMNVDSHPALAYAISRGTGWRADCIGDLSQGRFFESDGTPVNHMHDRYPRALTVDGVAAAWEHSPVVFETCWNMQYWKDQNWDVDFIFSKILEWHVSVLNNKSFPIPDQWRSKVDEFQKKMGYRFVLKRLEHPVRVKAGGGLALLMDWENQGAAPCYLDHPVAVQLRNVKTGTGWIHESGIKITGWLPGAFQVTEVLNLPPDIPPGDYQIRLAFLDPDTREPKIKLAISGPDEDGWYTLSKVRVR